MLPLFEPPGSASVTQWCDHRSRRAPRGLRRTAGSGSGDVPEQQVGRSMRRHDLAVREELPGVLEKYDPVTEQAPALLWVERHSVGRFPVGSVRVGTEGLV